VTLRGGGQLRLTARRRGVDSASQRPNIFTDSGEDRVDFRVPRLVIDRTSRARARCWYRFFDLAGTVTCI